MRDWQILRAAPGWSFDDIDNAPALRLNELLRVQAAYEAAQNARPTTSDGTPGAGGYAAGPGT